MQKDFKPHTITSNRRRKLICATLVVLIVLIPIVYFYFISLTQQTEAKAAIIDQLGSSKLAEAIRDENQTFVESARELLYRRFSIVDYYSDNATVEQYSKLASAGYKLILWRAHSALDSKSKYVAISTTDKNGSINYGQYPDDSLTLCNITGDPSLYFGITPIFIEQVMTGTFQDTVIVLMSCNGLRQDYLKTAQAFEAKGAKAIISWDNWVNTSDNDYGTSLLLQHLIDENNTLGVALGKLQPFSSEFGWARLRYDPVNLDVANYIIPDYRNHDDTNTSTTMLMASRPQRGDGGLILQLNRACWRR